MLPTPKKNTHTHTHTLSKNVKNRCCTPLNSWVNCLFNGGSHVFFTFLESGFRNKFSLNYAPCNGMGSELTDYRWWYLLSPPDSGHPSSIPTTSVNSVAIISWGNMWWGFGANRLPSTISRACRPIKINYAQNYACCLRDRSWLCHGARSRRSDRCNNDTDLEH